MKARLPVAYPPGSRRPGEKAQKHKHRKPTTFQTAKNPTNCGVLFLVQQGREKGDHMAYRNDPWTSGAWSDFPCDRNGPPVVRISESTKHWDSAPNWLRGLMPLSVSEIEWCHAFMRTPDDDVFNSVPQGQEVVKTKEDKIAVTATQNDNDGEKISMIPGLLQEILKALRSSSEISLDVQLRITFPPIMPPDRA